MIEHYRSLKNLVAIIYVLVLVSGGCRVTDSAAVDIKHPPLAPFQFRIMTVPELEGGIARSMHAELARYQVIAELGNQAWLSGVTLRLTVNSGETRKYIDGLKLVLNDFVVASSGPVLGAQEQAPKTAADPDDAALDVHSGLVAKEATMSVVGSGPGNLMRGDRVQITLVEVSARGVDSVESSTIPVGLKSHSIAYQ